MRLLIIDPAGGLWGSERALLDLISSLSDIKIAVCCPPGTPLQAELDRIGVRTLPYFVAELHKKSRWRRLESTLGLFRACCLFRPNVIYLNQSGAYRVALPVATALRLPIICHVRIFEDIAYLSSRSPSPSRVRGLIAISRAIKEEIQKFPNLAGIPTYQIYDSYVSAPRAAENADDLRLRNRVACIGRLVKVKGQEILLDALALTKAQSITVECLIVGEGDADYINKVKSVVTNSMYTRLQWTGYVNDIMPLLRTCGVLVCPSYREPLGRVIFEAWDAGAVPIVYAGAGGSAEIVKAADGGLAYEQQTPHSLAAALVKALDLEEHEAQRLVENGRAWMRRHCDPEHYGRAITAVLWSASIHAKPGPRVPDFG